jgi:hypothetical protein
MSLHRARVGLKDVCTSAWRAAGITAGLCGALLVGCGTSSTPTSRHHSSAAAATSSATAIDRLRVISSISVPIDGAPLEGGLGAVWSASSSGLVQLSLSAGRPKIVVREPIDDLALSASRVYALSIKRREVVEVDPHSLQVTRRWRVAPNAHSITTSDQDLYIAVASAPVGVERVNLRTGTITRSVIAGASALAQDRAIAFGAGKLWVDDGGSLYRLDPARLSVLGSTGLAASDIWFGDESLWAASDTPKGGVERIDPTTARIVDRSNADAIQIAFAPGIVWLAAAAGPTAVNSETARTIAALPPARVPTQGDAGIAVVGNEVWTTYGDVMTLQRIMPSG